MIWRTGSKVILNVYDGDRPVAQCHNENDARNIVAAVNAWGAPSREAYQASQQALSSRLDLVNASIDAQITAMSRDIFKLREEVKVLRNVGPELQKELRDLSTRLAILDNQFHGLSRRCLVLEAVADKRKRTTKKKAKRPRKRA